MEAAARAPELTEEAKRGRVKLAWAVVVGHAFKHLYNSAWQNILMPEIKIGMGLGGVQFGVLAGVSRASSWVTTMVAGYLGDRFSNHAGLMLGISLGTMGISFFLAGISPNYGVLLLAVLLMGFGPSLYHPPAISSLSRRFPDKRGFAISLHGTGGSVGEVMGPLAAAGMLTLIALSDFWGEAWRGVLQVSIVPALVGALVIWGVMRTLSGGPPVTTSLRPYISSLITLLRDRKMQALVAIAALRSMGQGAMSAFLPVYLRQDLEFSAGLVALYLALAQVVGIAAQPAMGFLSDRFGRKAVLIPGMGALGFLYCALTYADTGPQLVLTILAMGAFHYSLHAIFIAAAIDVARGHVQSTVVSLIYGAGFLGTASPIIAGAIADSLGTHISFLFAGSVVLAATAAMFFLTLPRASDQPQDP